MKKLVLLSLCLAFAAMCRAQTSLPFKGMFINEEYDVYFDIDLYEETIDVPGHELLGSLNGYLGKNGSSFYWLITSAKVENSSKASIYLINDYGSEDLEATVTAKSDGFIELKQGSGSTLKVANKGKWQKLPGTMQLKRKK